MVRSWWEVIMPLGMRMRTMKHCRARPSPFCPAGYARAVSLGVNAPPAEIGADPFRRDGVESLAGKAADFLQAFPWILRALQALDALCFGFFRCDCHRAVAGK